MMDSQVYAHEHAMTSDTLRKCTHVPGLRSQTHSLWKTFT